MTTLHKEISLNVLASLANFSTEVCLVISAYVAGPECVCHISQKTNPDAPLTTNCKFVRCITCRKLSGCQHCILTVCHCGLRCFDCANDIGCALECIICDQQTCASCRSGQCQICDTKVCLIDQCRTCLVNLCLPCSRNCQGCGVLSCKNCTQQCTGCPRILCRPCRRKNVHCSTCTSSQFSGRSLAGAQGLDDG